MASTLKCDTVTTLDGAGNITFSRPIVADGSNLTNLNISALAGNKLTGEVVAKGDGSSTDGKLTLNCSQNTHGVSIQSPAHSAGASYTLTLPTTNGNASEFLQTDGSGALTWAEAGGGGSWNIIGTATASNSSSLTITGIGTTYAMHVVIISDFKNANTGNSDTNVCMRLGTSSGVYTTSSYQWMVHRMGAYAGNTQYNGTQDNKWVLSGSQEPGGDGNEGFGARIEIPVTSNSSVCPHMMGQAVYTDEATDAGTTYFGGTLRNSNITFDRINVFMSSGNIESGRITLYGIAHA